MRSALLSLATFFIPFFLFGNHVGKHVAKHCAEASFCYSSRDVSFGYFAFFLFAGSMAGLVCLAARKILSFEKKPDKYLGLAAVLWPLIWGYLMADATLYGFYERIQFTGPVQEWLFVTAQAFTLWGLLPAGIVFLVVMYSISIPRETTAVETS